MRTGEATSTPADDLDELIAHMATRLRRLGTRHWREAVAESGATVADVAYDAVAWCARREGALDPARPATAKEVPDRPAYDAAIADQLAVVGRDLAIAVVDRPADAVEALVTLRAYAETLRVAPRER